MASIEKRADSNGKASYRVKVRLKGYPTQTATFERLTDARKWAQSTEAAIREGRHFKTIEAKRHTIAEMIDRYTRDVLPTKKPSTQAAQRFQFAALDKSRTLILSVAGAHFWLVLLVGFCFQRAI